MSIRTLSRLALAATAAVLAAPAQAVQIYGLTTTNALFTFDSASPANGSLPVTITGLAAGERMLSIDVRPTTNVLYGVSSASTVYSISALGVSTLVGTLDRPLATASVGIDFNPVADLAAMPSLRVVDSIGQNYAFNVANGSNVGTEVAVPAGYSAVAYANNDVNGSTGTALYYIDALTDVLRVANGGFNNPIINPVGALGVDANGVSGFDIFGASTGYAAFTDADTGKSSLYSINLGSGAATSLGPFGILGDSAIAPPVLGLTVSAVPEPGSVAMLLAGLWAVGALAKRRGARG